VFSWTEIHGTSRLGGKDSQQPSSVVRLVDHITWIADSDERAGQASHALRTEAGVAKSTASRKLRNVEQAVIPTITKYLQLFSES